MRQISELERQPHRPAPAWPGFARVADAAGAFTGVNPTWCLSGTRAELRGAVPAIGADRDDIMRDWLGTKL
jgi:crotonobetainyl-CoA:carnitine CoA-transferase CaiB-like acyl-CoA transferase